MADEHVQKMLRELRERYGLDLIPRPSQIIIEAMRELSEYPAYRYDSAVVPAGNILKNWIISIGEVGGMSGVTTSSHYARCVKVQGRARCQKVIRHPEECFSEIPEEKNADQ